MLRLKELYERDGEKKFAANIINSIKESANGTEGYPPLEDYSLGEIWEAMGKPALSRMRDVINRRGSITEDDLELSEALDSSAFPQITGQLISSFVQAGYDLEAGIADSLVTSITAIQKDETIVGFAHDDEVREVAENMPYEEGAVTEKYHKIKNRKYGRILSITEETIRFDQTGQIAERARRLGANARATRESQMMDVLLGVTNTGEFAAWRPNGTAATLYSNTSTDPFSTATQDNLIVDVLTDESDLDAATLVAAALTDEQGNRLLAWNPTTLLVGASLIQTASKILVSGQSVRDNAPAGVANIYSGAAVPRLSPYINQLVDNTSWWYGDFRRQFVLTRVWPLQTMQAIRGNEQEFERDVMLRFKVRYYQGIGAVTNRYVIKSTGGG